MNLVNSGSFFPNKSIIDSQINLTNENPTSLSEIKSKRVKGEILPLWNKAFVDLTRLSTLEINGKLIYKDNKIPLKSEDPSIKTNYVFQKIEEKLDSTTLALRASHLFEQQLGGGVLKEIAIKKGFTTEIQGQFFSTHAVNAVKKYNALNVKKDQFQMIHEELVSVRPMQDPENLTYFKVKTVVEGKISDLEMKDTENMQFQTFYTKETTEKQALKEDYLSISKQNRQSFIKG